MLTAQLLKEIKHIELRAGFIANEVLGGEYLSAFKGQGMEFDTLRAYQFGDDVRNIDWNVTARMNYPHVKIMREEREMTLILLIDVSASQHFGAKAAAKQESAAELAAVLAFLAIRNNDRVGLILFSDRIEQYIPAAKGRSHVWHIIKSIMTPRQFNHGTDLRQVLDFLMKVTHKKHMCFLISDFITPALPSSLGFDKLIPPNNNKYRKIMSPTEMPVKGMESPCENSTQQVISSASIASEGEFLGRTAPMPRQRTASGGIRGVVWSEQAANKLGEAKAEETYTAARTLANVARRHDLIAVQVQDAREAQLPASGLLDFIDSESGASITIDTSNSRTRAALQRAAQHHQQQLQALLRKHSIDSFSVTTAGSTAQPLMSFLRQRTRLRQR